MDLRHLASFREVVLAGSFTAAAARLHITQPAVSQHLKALESELGTRLMERDGRGIRLTRAGDVLLACTERALAALDDGRREIGEMTAPGRGSLVLACGDTVALHLLPPVLTAFRKQWPDAEIAVRNHGSQEILQLVVQREADVGIVTRPPHLSDDLWSRALRSDPMRLVVPKKHPLAERKRLRLSDLHGLPAVWLARPAETRSLIVRTLHAAGVEPRTVMESGNLEVVKRYVAAGLGISIVPEMAITPTDRRSLVVRDLPASMPARKIVVVRRKDRRVGILVESLLHLMAEHVLEANA